MRLWAGSLQFALCLVLDEFWNASCFGHFTPLHDSLLFCLLHQRLLTFHAILHAAMLPSLMTAWDSPSSGQRHSRLQHRDLRYQCCHIPSLFRCGFHVSHFVEAATFIPHRNSLPTWRDNISPFGYACMGCMELFEKKAVAGFYSLQVILLNLFCWPDLIAMRLYAWDLTYKGQSSFRCLAPCDHTHQYRTLVS